MKGDLNRFFNISTKNSERYKELQSTLNALKAKMGEKNHSEAVGGGSSTIKDRYDYFESMSGPPASRSFKKI